MAPNLQMKEKWISLAHVIINDYATLLTAGQSSLLQNIRGTGKLQLSYSRVAAFTQILPNTGLWADCTTIKQSNTALNTLRTICLKPQRHSRENIFLIACWMIIN